MCFTPAVSLTTAIIEFLLAAIIIIFFRRELINVFLAIFVFFLGFYQFTEFLLCTTETPLLWARIGFVVYTFLPALALNFILKIINTKKRINNNWSYVLIYFLPVFFSILALFYHYSFTQAQCAKFFVSINSLFMSNIWLRTSYWGYYFGFILLSSIIIISKFKQERNKIMKKIELFVLLAMLISLLPALLLIIIFPALDVMFPSIYCEFALVFSIVAILIVYYNSKLSKLKLKTKMKKK